MKNQIFIGADDTPETRIFAAIATKEHNCRKKAHELTRAAPPVSPYHFLWCNYCGKCDKRGSGLVALTVQYRRADGEAILYTPSKTICPACSGHGYLLTALGQRAEAQKQQGAA